MNKMKKIILSCLILTGCFITIGCSDNKKRQQRQEPPPIPVVAETPKIKDITVYLDPIGVLEPLQLVEIRPQVNGPITELFVEEGEWVKKGTPLLAIDSTPYAIKVQETESLLAMERIGHEAVQKKLNRYEMLSKKDLLSKTEWEDLEAQEAKARASIKLHEARLKTAQYDLEHCLLSSPIEGRIGKIKLYTGQLVSSSQPAPLLEIAKLDPLIVEFMLTEKEFPQISKGNKDIELETFCSAGEKRKAAITFFDNHFDPKSGLLVVHGRVENPKNDLRPGQSVRIQLPVSVLPNRVLIPRKAVRYNQQGPYVYVIQPDFRVAIRQVELGNEHEDSQIILNGIEGDENIVIEGHLRLSPGAKVSIIPFPENDAISGIAL